MPLSNPLAEYLLWSREHLHLALREVEREAQAAGPDAVRYGSLAVVFRAAVALLDSIQLPSKE